MRMKSRNLFPPGEWQVLHPEAGMKEPFKGSFNEAAMFEYGFRRKNPALAQKLNLPANLESSENWVDEFNANRCVAHGWTSFVNLESVASQVEFAIPDNSGGSKKKLLFPVVAGAKLLLNWLGSGEKPVEKHLAEKRASVCATCPKNDGGDWKAYFTTPAANQIKYLLEVKHDLNLSTSFDSNLTVCSACDCNLQLKVWSPLDIVAPNTPKEIWQRLDDRCWVIYENGGRPV